MREILFKGQRTDNKEWIYGHYFTEVGRGIDNSKNVIIHFIKDNFGTQIIIPETVCQYTGLNDKNGVKIFEGDIFSEKWRTVVYQNSEGTYIVRFMTNPKYNKPVSLEKYILQRDRAGCAEDCVIIGNIHDKETSEILINK